MGNRERVDRLRTPVSKEGHRLTQQGNSDAKHPQEDSPKRALTLRALRVAPWGAAPICGGASHKISQIRKSGKTPERSGEGPQGDGTRCHNA